MSAMDGTNIFSNINLFFNSLGLLPDMKEELRNFPCLTLDEKNRFYGCDDSHQYCLIRDNKKYYFDAFSSLDIEERDKEHIRNKDYSSNELVLKALEVAGYPTMINSKFIFATSLDELMFLVEFYKDGKYYIINLEYDMVMEKEKFYELKSIKEQKVLNKSQIYFLSQVFPKLKTRIPLIYFIIFYDEMMPELIKYEDFELSGYDDLGINYKNYFLFKSGCDAMFKQILKKYPLHEFNEINSLTIEKQNEYIKVNRDGKLVYGDYVFEKFSDYVIDEKKKKFLQSEERFGLCHSFAKYILLNVYRNKLAKNKKSTVRLVNGIVFYEGKHLVYHSWVEFMHNGILMVADLTQNLFMEKEMYYKYTKAQVLSVVDGETMNELEEYIKTTGLEFNSRLVDFFADELLADFKKNEKVLMVK